MISYFKSGYLIRYPVAFVIAALVWLPSIIDPESYLEQNSRFSLLYINFSWIEAHASFFIWVSFLITIISALAVNQILREYDLVNMHSTTGLVVFVLFTSALPMLTSVNSFILINVLLIMFILGLLKLSVVENPISEIFNASFYLGIASLLFTPLVYLIVFIWIALLTNRHLPLRNFLISMAGLLLPYLFIFTWFYLQENAIENGVHLLQMLLNIDLSIHWMAFTYFELGLIIFLLLLIVFSVLVTMVKLGEKTINSNRNIVVLLYYLGSTVLLLLLFSANAEGVLLLGLPAAFIVSIMVYSVNKNRFINLAFWLLFIGILFNHYYQLFDVKAILFK
jgi:hypothetical protein